MGDPNTGGLLAGLNNDVLLNATELLNNFIQDDENIQQFFSTNISSCYFDLNSFSETFKNNGEPLFISLNIQSLNS